MVNKLREAQSDRTISDCHFSGLWKAAVMQLRVQQVLAVAPPSEGNQRQTHRIPICYQKRQAMVQKCESSRGQWTIARFLKSRSLRHYPNNCLPFHWVSGVP